MTALSPCMTIILDDGEGPKAYEAGRSSYFRDDHHSRHRRYAREEENTHASVYAVSKDKRNANDKSSSSFQSSLLFSNPRLCLFLFTHTLVKRLRIRWLHLTIKYYLRSCVHRTVMSVTPLSVFYSDAAW